MRITYDDQYLITVSDDACLFIHKIADKEGRGKREKEVTYAEEILITKSDLEEKVNMRINSKNYKNLFSLNVSGDMVKGKIELWSYFQAILSLSIARS